jgi:hypothetical protein
MYFGIILNVTASSYATPLPIYTNNIIGMKNTRILYGFTGICS